MQQQGVIMKSCFLAIAVALVVGCNQPSSDSSSGAEPTSTAEAGNDTTSPQPTPQKGWQTQLGETVTITGKAVNHKISAYLYMETSSIYVDLPGSTHWPEGLYHGGTEGELVTVTGTIAHRSVLPVFILNPNEPTPQGIPVNEGTDLNEDSKAYVLEDVEWHLATHSDETNGID